MVKKFSVQWQNGALFICTKCGAKFDQPNLAEELKTELRKELKLTESNSKIRVMISGCLNVCYPDEQTFSYMPVSGETEVYTTSLEKSVALADLKDFLKNKLQS